MRVAGVMSGTSLDGIDVAVVDLEGSRFEVVKHANTAYPNELRERILTASNAVVHVADIARLNFLLAEVYAKAIHRCGVPAASIQLIGCHGQTVFHERGSTLQLGDGSVLAERMGIPVVSDFRPRDMAAGGRGAPLVPFVDYLLYRHKKLGRVALNIGGIANITAIPPAASADDVIAFDTGPGNMVIDQLVNAFTRGKQTFDRGGAVASIGRVDRVLLNSLLRRSYYRQKPPKTAGREQYGKEFVKDLRETGLSFPDLIATATAFTAATVAVGVDRFIRYPVDELIVSGGGVHNRTLMAYLQAFLPRVEMRTSDEFGVNSDAKEAIAFAMLAYRTWNRKPSNLPSATGARRPVVLGKVSY
jgi:anhydro-N-acetylmuramic acid kinase